MPPAKKTDDSSRRQKSIRDFFVIPKNRIPANDVIEEEIIVASPKRTHSSDNSRERKPSKSPAKEHGNSRRSPKASQTSSALSSLRSTPTKLSSPVAIRQKRHSPLPSPNTREDSSVFNTSSQASQWRVLSAVEIPSSSPTVKQTSPPSPTPPPPAPAMDAKPDITKPNANPTANAFTTSFSSISTLSSIPTSTASSSRRIIKNGLQAITNSDSGSADASSDEELADISTFIPRKRVKLTPTPPNEREDEKEGAANKTATRQSVRLSSDGGKRNNNGSLSRSRREELSPPPKKAVYKHSLVKMVAQKEREMKAAARLEEMDAAFAEAERKREEERRKDRVAMAGLRDVVADDSDEGERMMLAMQRTEALDKEEEVYFFAGMMENLKGSNEHATFPVDKLANEKAWVRQLADEEWRTQACLTGFVRELAEKDGLPLAVELWMTNQILVEKRDDLREAYVAVLEVCPKQDDKFGRCTYLLQNFYDLRRDPTDRLKPIPADPLQRLSQVLRILPHICLRMSDRSFEWQLFELILTNADTNLQKDAASKSAMETCVESILAQIPPDQLETTYLHVEQTMSTSPWSTKIKCRAVASMPAFSTRSHALRRRLALLLILQQIPLVPVPVNYYSRGDKLLSRLKDSPVFSISDSTDYALLNALIQILDIAIDAGFYLRPDESAHPPLHQIKNGEVVQPLHTVSKTEADKAFNAQIDAFVAQLTLMASRIRDAGTAHLRRTQAKIALERLCRRLEYSVRIGVRRRKGVFGADEGGAVGMLRGWLGEQDKVGDVDAAA